MNYALIHFLHLILLLLLRWSDLIQCCVWENTLNVSFLENMSIACIMVLWHFEIDWALQLLKMLQGSFQILKSQFPRLRLVQSRVGINQRIWIYVSNSREGKFSQETLYVTGLSSMFSASWYRSLCNKKKKRQP